MLALRATPPRQAAEAAWRWLPSLVASSPPCMSAGCTSSLSSFFNTSASPPSPLHPTFSSTHPATQSSVLRGAYPSPRRQAVSSPSEASPFVGGCEGFTSLSDYHASRGSERERRDDNDVFSGLEKPEPCNTVVALADCGHGVGRALLAALLEYPDAQRMVVAAATTSEDIACSLR